MGIKISRIKGKTTYFFYFKDLKEEAYAEQIFPIDEDGNMVVERE